MRRYKPEDLSATTTDVMVTNVTVLEGECTMTSNSCVASPGYPGNCSHDGSCTIAMPAGFVTAVSFETERFYDHHYVAGSRFDGIDGPQLVEVVAGDRVEWASDASVSGTGWEICHDETAPSVLTRLWVLRSVPRAPTTLLATTTNRAPSMRLPGGSPRLNYDLLYLAVRCITVILAQIGRGFLAVVSSAGNQTCFRREKVGSCALRRRNLTQLIR